MRFLDVISSLSPTFNDVPVMAQADMGGKEAMRSNAMLLAARLISRVTLFDGERWTLEQVLQLDARDSSELNDRLSPYLSGPIGSKS